MSPMVATPPTSALSIATPLAEIILQLADLSHRAYDEYAGAIKAGDPDAASRCWERWAEIECLGKQARGLINSFDHLTH